MYQVLLRLLPAALRLATSASKVLARYATAHLRGSPQAAYRFARLYGTTTVARDLANFTDLTMDASAATVSLINSKILTNHSVSESQARSAITSMIQQNIASLFKPVGARSNTRADLMQPLVDDVLTSLLAQVPPYALMPEDLAIDSPYYSRIKHHIEDRVGRVNNIALLTRLVEIKGAKFFRPALSEDLKLNTRNGQALASLAYVYAANVAEKYALLISHAAQTLLMQGRNGIDSSFFFSRFPDDTSVPFLIETPAYMKASYRDPAFRREWQQELNEESDPSEIY